MKEILILKEEEKWKRKKMMTKKDILEVEDKELNVLNNDN